MRCAVCRTVSFSKTDDGFYICDACGTQSQDFVEERLDDYNKGIQSNVAVRTKKTQVTTSEKRYTYPGGPGSFLECFQHLLMIQAETLITKYDVAPEIYSIVGRLWFQYLETRKRGHNKMENLPVEKRKTRGSRKKKKSKRKRKRRRVFHGVFREDDQIEEQEAEEPSEEEADEAEQETQTNTFSTHQDLEEWLTGIGAIKKNESEVVAEESSDSSSPAESSDSEYVDEEEKGKGKGSKRKKAVQKESESSSESESEENEAQTQVEGDEDVAGITTNSDYETGDVHLEIEGLPSLSLSLCFCFIACIFMREPLLLSDLLRWARTGGLPYISVNYPDTSHVHPKNLRLLRPMKFPGLSYLHKQTCLLLRHFDIQNVPQPVLPVILRRFFLELKFPPPVAKKLMKSAVRLHTYLSEHKLIEEDWLAFRITFNYTTSLMALVVILLKMCYNLDDQPSAQRYLSSSAKLKQLLAMMPSFEEWVISVRKDLLLPCQMPYFTSELWRLPREALEAYTKFCGEEVFSYYESAAENKDLIHTFASLGAPEKDPSQPLGSQNICWDDENISQVPSQSQPWSQASQEVESFSLNIRRRTGEQEEEEEEEEEEGEKEKGIAEEERKDKEKEVPTARKRKAEEKTRIQPASKYVMYDTLGNEAVRSSEELHKSYFFVLSVCSLLVEVSPFRLHWVIANIESRLLSCKPKSKPPPRTVRARQRQRQKKRTATEGEEEEEEANGAVIVHDLHCHQCHKKRARLLACPKKETHRYCDNCLSKYGLVIDDMVREPPRNWQNGCLLCQGSCKCPHCKRKQQNKT